MIHYSADGTLAVVHGLLPVGRLVIAARLVLVEARHCRRRRLLLSIFYLPLVPARGSPSA